MLNTYVVSFCKATEWNSINFVIDKNIDNGGTAFQKIQYKILNIFHAIKPSSGDLVHS